MPTLSIRTLTAASNKAKSAADERVAFFREQYGKHALGLVGKKNAQGVTYTTVEGGNHTSRKALKAALERLAGAPTASEETDLVLIADYAFMKNGKEEERRIVKEGEKEKVVKEDVEREGVHTLLATWGDKFRTVTVLYENSPEGSQDERELLTAIRPQPAPAESAKDPSVRVLYARREITPELYAGFLKISAGLLL